MEAFPKIETLRLVLSELKAKDIPRIVQYASNETISANTLNIPYPYHEKDAIYWLNQAFIGFKEGSQYIWGIRLKPTQDFIGGISLIISINHHRAEIGYWIGEPFWNKGYTTEATQALIKFCFEKLNLDKITSSHIVYNPASGRVMEKCGMIKEGILSQHIYKKGAYHDLVQYGLTRKQYDEAIMK